MTLVSIVSVGVGVAVAVTFDSVTLGVFWGVEAGYTLRTVAGISPDGDRVGEPPGMVRRTIVAVLTASVALGVLALATDAWSHAWTAIAVALVAGGFSHVVMSWLASPAPLRKQTFDELREGQVEFGPGDVAPETVALVSAIGAIAALVGVAVLEGIWNGLLAFLAIVFAICTAIGLWARGKVRRSLQ